MWVDRRSLLRRIVGLSSGLWKELSRGMEDVHSRGGWHRVRRWECLARICTSIEFGGVEVVNHAIAFVRNRTGLCRWLS